MEVEEGDVGADDRADHEDENGQVAGLLTSRPGDLLELGPGLLDEAPDAGHELTTSKEPKLAGATGLEPATAGFGDQCSTN